MDTSLQRHDVHVVAVPEAGAPCRLIAAWDAACHVNNLNWQLQIALLKLDEFDWKTYAAENVVARLALQAMDLVEFIREKDSLREAILAAWSESEFVFPGPSSPLEYSFWLARKRATRAEGLTGMIM